MKKYEDIDPYGEEIWGNDNVPLNEWENYVKRINYPYYLMHKFMKFLLK